MKRLKQQIIILHEILIKYSGGANGVRDIGLLDSALETPLLLLKGFQIILQFKARQQGWLRG